MVPSDRDREAPLLEPFVDPLAELLAHSGDRPGLFAVGVTDLAELRQRHVDVARVLHVVAERAEHVLENEEVALSEVEARADDAFYALRIRVLERLPVADDPWHPELDAALLADQDGLLALLTESPEGIEHAAATEALVAAQARVDEARVESAVRWRLLQAWEAIALASALRAHGGPSWETFRALRACEMGR